MCRSVIVLPRLASVVLMIDDLAATSIVSDTFPSASDASCRVAVSTASSSLSWTAVRKPASSILIV